MSSLSQPSTTSAVESLKSDIYIQLIDLAGDQRKKAIALVDELKIADKMLRSAELPPPSRYAAAVKIIDAVAMYLEDIDRPAKAEEIAEGLVKVGYKALSDMTSWRILKAIQNNLTGTGIKNLRVRKVKELIGLVDWPDSKFEMRS